MNRIARPSTTLRIALISALLAFFTNAALIGYVRYTTQTNALADIRERVTEEAQTLREALALVPAPKRATALQRNIAAADPDFIAGLFDRSGRRLSGNAPAALPKGFAAAQSYEVMDVSGDPPGDAGMIALPLQPDGYLVTGRRFGDALSLANNLERALVLATLFAALLGGATGLAVAAYVHRRVRGMVRTIDGIGSGDIAMRLADGGSSDGFDLLARRINLMLDRIDALLKELRVLTDSLAHDLRSPIGRLRTKIERALAIPEEKPRSELLGSALLDADALTRQLTTVLEIGRAEAMTGTARFETVDPQALLQELADLYEPVADEAGMAITVETAPALPPLLAHRQLLTQALGNLIDNAILHASAGHELMLSAAPAPDAIRLIVADRGPGISAEQHAEALRRFGRLDAARSKTGAGLGLSLVEAVARLHHGQFLLEDNRPGLRAVLQIPQSSGERPATQL